MTTRRSLLFAATVLVSALFVGGSPASAAVVPSQPSRVLDTRSGIGGVRGPVRAGQVVRIPVPAGAAAAGATAIALNVTATESTSAGFVTVWSCGEARPATSNLNFVAGRSVPNMVVARVIGSTPICLYASSRVQLIADVMGWFTGSADVVPTTPNRILDTRRTNSPLKAGVVRRVRLGGTAGVAASASAAMINITVVKPRSDGFLSAFPCPASGNAVPRTSTLNFQPGDIVAAFTTIAMSGSDICVWSKSDTEVIIDTFGWTAAAGGLRLLPPSRVFDTRDPIWGVGPARHNATVRVRVAGRGGVPNEASAGLFTLTVADVSAHGHVTAWPCDAPKPNASVLNFWPGAVRANSALLSLSAAGGEICLSAVTSNRSSVSLIVDAVGFVPGTINRPPPPPLPTRFATLPPRSALPSGAQCAARVRDAAEIRPDNVAANNRRGGRQYANDSYNRVDGDFTGTTDEIIQWAACKWGLDEDMARAQIIKESAWHQSANGDNGESWGLGQVRVPYHQTAFEFAAVNARNSSAYNLDYTYAFWRACFEGEYTWLNTVERGRNYAAGDAWGCMGVWFSGRWYTQPAIDYIEGTPSNWGVKDYFVDRFWLDPEFLNW